MYVFCDLKVVIINKKFDLVFFRVGVVFFFMWVKLEFVFDGLLGLFWDFSGF